MPEKIDPVDQEIIDKALQSMRSPNRHAVPLQKVKHFRKTIAEELIHMGHLKKEFVDQLVQQLKSE